MISWKNKKTEEIIKLVSITLSLEGSTIAIRDSKGEPHKFPEEYFKENFDPVQVDFQKFQVELVEFCKSTEGLRNVLEAISRRYHPGGYFHEGDKVFITDAPLLFSASNPADPKYYFTSGPDYPYIIHKIEKQDINKFKIYVERASIKPKHFADCSLCFDAWVDKIVPLDAFWTLQRYDMPY